MKIADAIIDQNVRSGAREIVVDEIIYRDHPAWRERWTDLMRRAWRCDAMPVMIVRCRCSVAGDLVIVRRADLEELLRGNQ